MKRSGMIPKVARFQKFALPLSLSQTKMSAFDLCQWTIVIPSLQIAVVNVAGRKRTLALLMRIVRFLCEFEVRQLWFQRENKYALFKTALALRTQARPSLHVWKHSADQHYYFWVDRCLFHAFEKSTSCLWFSSILNLTGEHGCGTWGRACIGGATSGISQAQRMDLWCPWKVWKGCNCKLARPSVVGGSF